MLLSTVTAAGVSTNVWAAAARTLTADPATDLGAAKLVWDRTTVAPAAGGFGALVNLNLDAAVSSRLSTVINSIQQGTIVIANASFTNTATISSVNTAKSVCYFQGQAGNTTAINDELGYVQLTNATTVTATRGLNADALTLAYVVVEYK